MGFQKTVEDFVCEHCGTSVAGSGFTNHCPKCLYSKHVDIDPGDRAATCGGLMEPVALEGSSPDYSIVHVCSSCGHRKRNKTTPQDDPAALLSVARKAAL